MRRGCASDIRGNLFFFNVATDASGRELNARDGLPRGGELGADLKSGPPACRCLYVLRPSSLLRSPGALIITTLAATDLAYRLLLREPVRRVLGMRR